MTLRKLRRRKASAFKFVAVAILTIFSPETPVSSQLASPDFAASEFTFPKEWGSVAFIETPPVVSAGKTVVFIQDAHVNYQAQKNTAAIVDDLASRYGVRLILLEGGEGDGSLAFMRKRGTPSARLQVAEEDLRKGLLSGAEYLDIVSEHPLILWGIEDAQLYAENYSGFLEAEEARQSLEPEIASLRAIIEQLKAAVFSEPLRALEARQKAFKANELALGEYVRWLADHGDQLPLAEYPMLKRFAGLSASSNLDMALVAEDQGKLLRDLQSKADPEAFAPLRQAGQDVKSGKAPASAFYLELAALAERSGADAAAYPHLTDYVEYLKAKAALQPRVLWEDLRRYQDALKRKLAQSADESALLEAGENLEWVENLLALRWTSTDWEKFEVSPERLKISTWLPALLDLAQRQGNETAWQGDIAGIDKQVSRALRFYEAARQRNEALVSRALGKMEQVGDPVAVMVAGGFHTDACVKLLADRGIQVLVITPSVGPADDGARYAALLKEKMEMLKTPFAKSYAKKETP